MINLYNKPIAIYGAGNLGLKVFELLKSKEVPCKYIIDKYKKLDIEGVTSITLDEVGEISDKESLTVILCTLFASVPNSDIIIELETKKFKSIIHAGVLSNVFPNEFNHFFLTSQKNIDSHKLEIDKTRSLFKENVSIKLFDELMDLRYSLNFFNLSLPDIDNNYFPPDLQNILYNDFEKIVYCDIGAYNGDTFTDLEKRSDNKLKHYIGFEPEKTLFDQLSQKTKTSKISCEIYQYGTWDSDTKFYFGEKDQSSAINNSGGDYEINCVCLDSFNFTEKPTIYKMDIEGAELPTLRGMKNIIKNQRPILEVCLYHKPNDMWEIPLYIHSLNPAYKFFLRAHEYNGLQTVLYCV